MSSSSNHKRWTVIAGALIVQVILGTVYAFSVFVRPLESEFGWDRTTTQWAFSAALATFALMMIPAGKLQDRIGPRKVATIGGVISQRHVKLGNTIRAANNHYNDTVKGLVGKQGLHGKVERFQQLSTKANKEMAALEPIHEEIETDRLESTRSSTEIKKGPALLDSSAASSAKIKPIKAD